MINIMREPHKLTGMILEGKVVVDSLTLGNDNLLGVYIPAMQPTVGIANSAEELSMSIDTNRFTACSNAAEVDSSISAINYMIVTLMRSHNTDPPPLQEGEHVFVGFIDNDLKKPFVYPWGSRSSMRHRMRDKIKILCSNKKTVSGELTDEHFHYFEIDSEAMKAKMHISNSEGEKIGLDFNVDFGEGKWDITDTAGNTFRVIADEETLTNNEMHMSNADQCNVDMVGEDMDFKAKNNVFIGGKNVYIEAEENFEAKSSTHINTTADFAVDASGSAYITAPDLALEAKMDLILLGMNIKASAQIQADFIASVMQNLGVAPSSIGISPAMVLHGSPIVSSIGSFMAPALVPGATGGPPGPVTPPTAPTVAATTSTSSGGGTPPTTGEESESEESSSTGSSSSSSSGGGDTAVSSDNNTPATTSSAPPPEPPPPGASPPPPPPPGSPPPLMSKDPGPASITDTAGVGGIPLVTADMLVNVLGMSFDSMMAVSPSGAPVPVGTIAKTILTGGKVGFTTTKSLGV